MFKLLITGFMAAAFLTGCATPRGEATRLAVDEILINRNHSGAAAHRFD